MVSSWNTGNVQQKREFRCGKRLKKEEGFFFPQERTKNKIEFLCFSFRECFSKNFVVIYHFSLEPSSTNNKLWTRQWKTQSIENCSLFFQQKYYLFVSLHIIPKISHNAVEFGWSKTRIRSEWEERERKVENVEQQQTVQAGRKITCKHIRDDVWRDKKFSSSFLFFLLYGKISVISSGVYFVNDVNRNAFYPFHHFNIIPKNWFQLNCDSDASDYEKSKHIENLKQPCYVSRKCSNPSSPPTSTLSDDGKADWVAVWE